MDDGTFRKKLPSKVPFCRQSAVTCRPRGSATVRRLGTIVGRRAANSEVIRENEPGKSPAAIAAELGVSRQFVSKTLKAAGQPSDFRSSIPHKSRPGAVKPFLDRAPFGQLLDLLDLSNEDAGKLLGLHPVTVAKHANGKIEAPEATNLVLYAAVGLGLDTAHSAIAAGRRKLKNAVDQAKA